MQLVAISMRGGSGRTTSTSASTATISTATVAANANGFSTTKTIAEEAMEDIIFPTKIPTTTTTTTSSVVVGDAAHAHAAQSGVDNIVLGQLRELVSRVAELYREDRPFHSFEHASHTVLSITKLLVAIETNTRSKIDWVKMMMRYHHLTTAIVN